MSELSEDAKTIAAAILTHASAIHNHTNYSGNLPPNERQNSELFVKNSFADFKKLLEEK